MTGSPSIIQAEKSEKSRDILDRIHHVDPWIKVWGNRPLYWFAGFVVTLVFFSGYRLRIFWAFSLNFFFNSPIVYLGILAQKVALPINRFVMGVFYLSVFAVYSIPYRLFSLLKSGRGGWVHVSQADSSLEEASRRF